MSKSESAANEMQNNFLLFHHRLHKACREQRWWHHIRVTLWSTHICSSLHLWLKHSYIILSERMKRGLSSFPALSFWVTVHLNKLQMWMFCQHDSVVAGGHYTVAVSPLPRMPFLMSPSQCFSCLKKCLRCAALSALIAHHSTSRRMMWDLLVNNMYSSYVHEEYVS